VTQLQAQRAAQPIWGLGQIHVKANKTGERCNLPAGPRSQRKKADTHGMDTCAQPISGHILLAHARDLCAAAWHQQLIDLHDTVMTLC
jgi:hypothetical protein